MGIFKSEEVYYLDIINATLIFVRQALKIGNEEQALSELDSSIGILFKFNMSEMARALVVLKESILVKAKS